MKENLLDNNIKNTLKHKNTKVPKIIGDRIDLTLAGLQEEKKNVKWYKKGTVAAAIAGITLLGVGVHGYAYVNDVKASEVILNILGVNSGYSKVMTEYGVTNEINGVKLSVENVVFDGYNMAVSYTIKGENEITEDKLFNRNNITGMISTGAFSKNTLQLCSDYGKFTDETKTVYKGAFLFKVDGVALSEENIYSNIIENSHFNSKSLENDFKLELNIDNVAGTDNKLEYKLDINTKLAKENIKEVKINKSIVDSINNIEINSTIVTPLRLYLNATITGKYDVFTDFIVLDNNNKVLKPVGGTTNYVDNKSSYIGEFEVGDENITSITIIPYRYDKVNKSNGTQLNLNGETKLPVGNGKEITITKVYEKDGDTYVTYKSDAPINKSIPFNFIDKNGVEYYRINDYEKNVDDETEIVFRGQLLDKRLNVATYTTLYYDSAIKVAVK